MDVTVSEKISPPGKTAPPPNSQVKHVTISPESRWPIKPINMNGNLTIRLNLRICKENLFCFRGDPDSDLDLATSYPNSKFIAILPGDLIQAVQVDFWPKAKNLLFTSWSWSCEGPSSSSCEGPSWSWLCEGHGFFFRTSSTQSLESCSTTVRRRWRIFLVGQCCSIIPTDQSINLPINQLIRWSSVQGVSNVNVFPSIPSGGSYPITSPMSPSPPITNHLPRILLSGHHNLASCPLRSTFPPTVTPLPIVTSPHFLCPG